LISRIHARNRTLNFSALAGFKPFFITRIEGRKVRQYAAAGLISGQGRDVRRLSDDGARESKQHQQKKGCFHILLKSLSYFIKNAQKNIFEFARKSRPSV
jgi:hypothetical protein